MSTMKINDIIFQIFRNKILQFRRKEDSIEAPFTHTIKLGLCDQYFLKLKCNCDEEHLEYIERFDNYGDLINKLNDYLVKSDHINYVLNLLF